MATTLTYKIVTLVGESRVFMRINTEDKVKREMIIQMGKPAAPPNFATPLNDCCEIW